MSSFSNISGSSGAEAPLKEENNQCYQPSKTANRDNHNAPIEAYHSITPAITNSSVNNSENEQSKRTQILLKSKKFTFDDPSVSPSSSKYETKDSVAPELARSTKEVHFELPAREGVEQPTSFRSNLNSPSHHAKVYLETNLDSDSVCERRTNIANPSGSVGVPSSSEVSTSPLLIRNGNANAAPKCIAVSQDYWNQVGQQVPYIDSSGGSARNSLLLSCGNQIPPGGGSGYQILVDRSLVGQPGSDSNSLNSQDLSAPSSPLQLHPHNFSFKDHTRKKRAKLSRFYSQQEPDCTPTGGIELRVLEPLLSEDDGAPIANSVNGQSSLATVREGETEILPAANRRELRKLKHSNTIACSGRKRKTSSWEESVSLQRRRSIASREEAREWRDKVLTAEGDDVAASTPTTKEDTPQDLRYYFQHPYLRLFATYFVIFCNFLLFAEDPISHSHAESVIPMVGNVFSFVLTKYPPEWRWALIKVLMWLTAIICGLIVGKLFVHNILCGKILRLKMFRDEQGSWIAMFLTVIVSLYLFSHVYNLILLIFYDKSYYFIDSRMGITYASVMKTAACGTWLGDLITALMVTDVMLQDNLYPEWAPSCRRLWRRSNLPRILIFWVVSVLSTGIVVTLIISDYISWDRLNRDFVASTELTRAFLASFILVMDILIMMQDWDFPHFTTTLHINLPGFSVATLEWKYAEVHLTGKWFNYGLIFMVMLLDLNMWKNQIFYYPARFGQYTAPDDNKIRTVNDQQLLQTANRSLWTWESRSQINETTGLPYFTNDVKMNSRYMGYPLLLKITAFIPSGIGMVLFISIIVLHGRFPNNQGNTVTRGSEGITTSKDGVSV